MAANHPQLGTALANIAELNKVYLEHQRESLREAAGDARRASKDDRGARERKKKSKSKSKKDKKDKKDKNCLLYTSPSPRD